MIPENTLDQLQKELDATFQKAERQRKILRVSQIACYGTAFLFFLFVISMMFLPAMGLFVHDYVANPNPTFWEANPILIFIIPAFALIFISSWIFPQAFSRFTTLEKSSVQKIMGRLFPQADFTFGYVHVPKSTLLNSKFYPELKVKDSSVKVFGAFSFRDKVTELKAYEVATVKGSGQNIITNSAPFMYIKLLQQVFGMAFSSRFDNSLYAFRGLFAYAVLPKKINGTVIILPDKLTSHLDYLAETIQAMKTVDGSKLVKLEDPEFERRFAVYSTDENLARYILTPLMMQQMTSLHTKYNRDIMLSFNDDKFHFSVPMPEGLLTLGDKSITGRNSVQIIYDNVTVAQSILKELRLG